MLIKIVVREHKPDLTDENPSQYFLDAFTSLMLTFFALVILGTN